MDGKKSDNKLISQKLAEYEKLEEKLIIHTGMNLKEWIKHTTSIFNETKEKK